MIAVERKSRNRYCYLRQRDLLHWIYETFTKLYRGLFVGARAFDKRSCYRNQTQSGCWELTIPAGQCEEAAVVFTSRD